METFNVIIRGGANPPNRVSGDATDGIYYVDWSSVLPKKYKRFQLSSYFRNTPRSDLTSTDDDFVCVECSAFPKQDFYDTKRNGRSNFICVAPTYLCFINGANFYLYNESNASNTPDIQVQYPTENQFQIKLTDLAGATLTAGRYTEWMLVLNFRGIEDKHDK